MNYSDWSDRERETRQFDSKQHNSKRKYEERSCRKAKEVESGMFRLVLYSTDNLFYCDTVVLQFVSLEGVIAQQGYILP